MDNVHLGTKGDDVVIIVGPNKPGDSEALRAVREKFT
jgi:hypothetical protein